MDMPVEEGSPSSSEGDWIDNMDDKLSVSKDPMLATTSTELTTAMQSTTAEDEDNLLMEESEYQKTINFLSRNQFL